MSLLAELVASAEAASARKRSTPTFAAYTRVFTSLRALGKPEVTFSDLARAFRSEPSLRPFRTLAKFTDRGWIKFVGRDRSDQRYVIGDTAPRL